MKHKALLFHDLTTARTAIPAALSDAKILLFSAMLVLGIAPFATAQVVPTLVQHDASSSTRANPMSSPYCYSYALPNQTVAGNAIIAGVTFAGNPILTVTDDKGDAYAVERTYYDSADGQSVAIAAAFNVASGARRLSACFNANPNGYVQAVATEFSDVTGFDFATPGATGTGTSVTSGSATPSLAGDLVYQLTTSLNFSNFPNQTSFAPGSQSNITWTLLSADTDDGLAAEYGVYGSTAALNPAMTLGSGQHWASVAVFLTTGQTGSVPTGMRIVHLDHQSVATSNTPGDVQFTTPTHFQIPSSGNLIVAMMGGGYQGQTITSLTDSNSNSWQQAGSVYQFSGGSANTVQTMYAGNANASNNLAVTVKWSGTNGDFNILFYDIAGAAAQPFDTANGTTGTATNFGSYTPPFTISAAAAGELVLSDIIVDFNTVSGMTQSGQLFDADWFSGEAPSGPQPLDQNNGWGHFVSVSSSAINFTWSQLYSAGQCNCGNGSFSNYAAMAAAFKPGSGAAPLPPTNLSIVVQ
jgi:hypothetical protein